MRYTHFMDEQETCPVCGATFVKMRWWQRFCKDACRVENWRRRWIRKYPRKDKEEKKA